MRVLLALLLALVLAACGGKSAPNESEARWLDADGKEVPELVVSTYRGAEHCDWQSIAFLHLGWPLGTNESIGAGRQYVRDPESLFPEEYAVAPLDLDAELPANARYTGYHRDDVELWLSESEADEAVYIVTDEDVERWPRTVGVIACA